MGLFGWRNKVKERSKQSQSTLLRSIQCLARFLVTANGYDYGHAFFVFVLHFSLTFPRVFFTLFTGFHTCAPTFNIFTNNFFFSLTADEVFMLFVSADRQRGY